VNRVFSLESDMQHSCKLFNATPEAGQIPAVRGTKRDVILNNHGDLSFFNFHGPVCLFEKKLCQMVCSRS
jgi:hypothetical protein